MLRFVFRKMLNKKWMILSLLIGNVFLISIAMSGPMYTRAVTQNLLSRTLSDSYSETGVYPALFTLDCALSSGDPDSRSVLRYKQARDDIAYLAEKVNTPSLYTTEYSTVSDYSASPAVERADESASLKLSISTMTDLDKHIELVAGRTWSATPDEDGVYDALISRSAFVRNRFIMNEVLSYKLPTLPDGETFKIRIAGIFESTADPWWIKDESSYHTEIFIPQELFHQLFLNLDAHQDYHLDSLFSVHLDREKLSADNVDAIIAETERLSKAYNKVFLKNFNASCETLLTEYRTEASRSSATLKVLQVPVFALLIAFMFMISRQTLETEQSEISVLKSRGASGWQILRIYLSQSLILAVIALAISVPVSAFLCQAIGSANAFLKFVSRSALHVEYTLEVAAYAAVSALVGVLTMVMPAISYSRLSIVDAKRGRHALGHKPVWQKFFFDVILLAASCYGLYTFNNQKDMLAEKIAGGAALDPLIYISSSLFAVGASLFMVRVIPMLASGVFRLFKRRWKPAMYASFLQVLRSRNNQTFIMAFLMLTIAIGIYNADTASTVNTLREEQLRYDLGADVVLKESWTLQNGEYVESDVARYEQIDGVESVTKVFTDDGASVSFAGKNLSNMRLMGIDAKAFGETAYMKDGLMDEHFFTYLNAMSQTRNYALVSSTFRDNLGLEEGDSISVKLADAGKVNLVIAKFVDFFPTYNSSAWVYQEDGSTLQTDKYLVVANLGFLQSNAGLLPYEIWLKSPESADNVYAFAAESKTSYWAFSDVYTRLDAMKNSPSIQGTNGILTLSFIVGLTLCAVGFLIFWILSIKSRSLQFGIYRAMGMSVGEIVTMLVNEHVWQSLSSVISGVGIGYLVSRLFVPLIQMAYSSAEASLPLAVTRDLADHMRLVGIILAVLIICVCVLITLIRKLGIAQALKLGED